MLYEVITDIVRIVGTDVVRKDVQQTDAQGKPVIVSRDVRFINAKWPDGKDRVYRNEDTGWGWPPYFKFDTASLQTEADDLKSSPENPKWAVVTHYGWRNQLLSIFPNAISIKPVAGPDVRIIPWANIILLSVFILIRNNFV